eukprot:COSAG01_NODE_5576_length_4173_cov_4.860334_3_plen_148_part_00
MSSRAVFGNATIEAFHNFTATTPTLQPAQTDEETSTVLGFQLGGDGGSDGLVFALLLGNGTWTGTDMTVTLSFDVELRSAGKKHICEMVIPPSGEVFPLSPTTSGRATRQLQLAIPVGMSPLAIARSFGGPKDPFAVSVSYVKCVVA